MKIIFAHAYLIQKHILEEVKMFITVVIYFSE